MHTEGERPLQAGTPERERDLDPERRREHEQRWSEALTPQRHEDDGQRRDEDSEVRDETADEQDDRERSCERRPEHHHDHEHRRASDRGCGRGRPHEAADPEGGVATAVAEWRAFLMRNALKRPLRTAIGVEQEEEGEERAQDRDRGGPRDVAGELSELVLDEPGDHRRKVVDRRCDLRRER